MPEPKVMPLLTSAEKTRLLRLAMSVYLGDPANKGWPDWASTQLGAGVLRRGGHYYVVLLDAKPEDNLLATYRVRHAVDGKHRLRPVKREWRWMVKFTA